MTREYRALPFENTIAIKMAAPVSPLRIFSTGLWRSLFRKQGALVHKSHVKLIVDMKGIRPEAEKVKNYRKVCGFPVEGASLPITFPETLFISPLGRLVTSRNFPLSPAGLIHVGQDIRYIKPIPVDSRLDLCCYMSKLAETGRGFLLDVAMEIKVNEDLAWEGTARFLSRFKNIIKKKGRDNKKTTNTIPAGTREDIDVPRNIGLLYAGASGDYNPHHLYGFTAKPLGYKRPIAHGMWSLARSLASIENHLRPNVPNSVQASFKLPIFMPSMVSLNWETHKDGSSASFSLTDAKDYRPHVNGTLETE